MQEPTFIKFPRTHWLPIGEKPYKSERYLTDSELHRLLSGEVHVSEKLDGANVGIRFFQGRLVLQKRGNFVEEGEHPQYGALKEWAYRRYESFSKLPGDMVLFGEWLFAKHSIHYTKLPDYFFLFDIWLGDKFLPMNERDRTAEELSLITPPNLYQGRLSLRQIPKLIKKSHFSEETVEGIVVRSIEDANLRGKHVRHDFIRGKEHWTSYNIERNLTQK